MVLLGNTVQYLATESKLRTPQSLRIDLCGKSQSAEADQHESPFFFRLADDDFPSSRPRDSDSVLCPAIGSVVAWFSWW